GQRARAAAGEPHPEDGGQAGRQPSPEGEKSGGGLRGGRAALRREGEGDRRPDHRRPRPLAPGGDGRRRVPPRGGRRPHGRRLGVPDVRRRSRREVPRRAHGTGLEIAARHRYKGARLPADRGVQPGHAMDRDQTNALAGRRYVLAVTGGSGVTYGRRLYECLARTGATVHLVVSEAGQKVIKHELQIPLDLHDGPGVVRALLGEEAPNVQVHHYKDLEVGIASGSYKTEGMAIVPCSGGTLGRISCGASSNLIERAAEVCLKERRKLILVPRETPYSEIMIENMLRVTRAGA